ncbi:MAG: GTP cyclohydrolase I FolE2 [Thermoplasmata archaeon]|nr:MAG: GTP cyclohydrolase I FolE2 [Thermoplasmata archaeon]RLF36849.1 MAG: GTP cyclohydrolase I FolE2 [Thermoplasmata archaeon]RLF53634.1 MAG: GTP cyclohydrolase I FolE2 [Thermoplasmata archaeon]
MKSLDLPDVQSSPSQSNFKLTRVGVTGVKKLVNVRRPGRAVAIPLVVKMDLFVDLPAFQKGSHMSRNLELVSEVIDADLQQPVSDLETFCAKTAKLLLKKHEYATFSEVKAEADYFLERTYPSGNKGLEPYKLVAEARAHKDDGVKKLIGVRVIGMTTCPCAREVIKAIGDYKKDEVPPTHNQRNITTLMIEVPGDDKSVDANDLIDIVEDSFSSPTYSILKRREEGQLVFDAHKNPKFVEDVVRDILSRILKKYRNLPDDVLVVVRSESEESIHKHNAFAERVTTLGELRK